MTKNIFRDQFIEINFLIREWFRDQLFW